MNIFTLEIWDDETAKCTFYTVRDTESEANETDKFFDKYDSIDEYKESNTILLSFVLKSIGNIHGPKDSFFNRKENEVIGLPNKGKVRFGDLDYCFPDFPLRLYALKISEDIVVLFNGGVKDGSKNQNSSLNLKWKEACSLARKICVELNNKTIIINSDRKLIRSDGSNIIDL